jgi:hypothetical protein
MDMMMDRGLLEYDKMLQEKHEKEGAARATESRKKRRQLEEVDKSIRAQQEKMMVSKYVHI